jgi:hypothetical protein
MSAIIDASLYPPPRVHRAASAADERRVRRLGALIFAELLPQLTARTARTGRPAAPPRPPSGNPGGRQSGRAATRLDTAKQKPPPSHARRPRGQGRRPAP